MSNNNNNKCLSDVLKDIENSKIDYSNKDLMVSADPYKQGPGDWTYSDTPPKTTKEK
jgi:hypothetical protein